MSDWSGISRICFKTKHFLLTLFCMELDFLNIKHNNVPPKNGRVLISEPFSKDLFFKRSVVFLTEHNDDGTVGFILNKPSELNISELIEDFPDKGFTVSIGGPVQTNTIHYLHTLGDAIPGSLKVTDEIYWGGDIEHIKVMAESDLIAIDQIRFFVGYSGWSEGQLDDELKNDFWIVSEIKKEGIFTPEIEATWKSVLQKMEEKYKIWTSFPENPEMN
jgi:putative transcriptional regulator